MKRKVKSTNESCKKGQRRVLSVFSLRMFQSNKKWNVWKNVFGVTTVDAAWWEILILPAEMVIIWGDYLSIIVTPHTRMHHRENWATTMSLEFDSWESYLPRYSFFCSRTLCTGCNWDVSRIEGCRKSTRKHEENIGVAELGRRNQPRFCFFEGGNAPTFGMCPLPQVPSQRQCSQRSIPVSKNIQWFALGTDIEWFALGRNTVSLSLSTDPAEVRLR